MLSPFFTTFDTKRSSVYLDKLLDKRPKAKVWIRSSDVNTNPYADVPTQRIRTELVNQYPTLRRKFYQSVLVGTQNPIRQAC